ncbi:MAG: tetratricopeptide repeat protein [Saprospiraceae bacterium]
MKKIIFILLSIILTGTMINAQDSKDLLKKSNKLLTSFYFDQNENANDLVEASKLIDQALELPDAQSNWKAWLTKGKIYNEIANADVKSKILDPKYVIKNPDAAITAFEALKKASTVLEKPKQITEVLKLMQETENHLNNIAAYDFQDGNYSASYQNFKRTFEAYDLFKQNGEEKDSRLSDPATMSEQNLYTGYSAYYGENKNDALKYFKALADNDTDQPFVYEALFNIYADQNNETEAMKYLETGRNKFSNDTGLLYAEINYYIKKGKLNELIDKLKTAIELDPKNVTVYTTLGSVYDQLNTKAYENGDSTAQKEYFNDALTYFNKALEIEPNNFDATYSIGALYYNHAANYTQEINKYANDFSSAGTKKYNDLKKQMLELFTTAKPYFEKAYNINEKDLGVLQALSEISARQDKLDEAKIYRDKLAAAKAEQEAK